MVFRITLFLTFLSLSAMLTPVCAMASFVVLRTNGEVVWNVLADEATIALDIPRSSHIEVKEAASEKLEENSQIKLSKENGKISLAFDGEGTYKEVDVSGLSEDLIEVEERPEVQTMNIGIYDGKFGLMQRGVLALTDFPIKIDTKEAKIEVETPTGDRLVSVLPFQAVQSVLRTNFMTTADAEKIELFEEDTELSYRVPGEKLINFFDLYYYPIAVSANVSASTGELIKLEAPVWWKAISFFLS